MPNNDLQRLERLLRELYTNIRPAEPAKNRVLMAYSAQSENASVAETAPTTNTFTPDTTTMKWGYDGGATYFNWGMGQWL